MAELLGVSAATVGNMESQNHIVIREERVAIMAKVLELDPAAAAELTSAWKALPISDYAKSLRKTWAKRAEMRGKVKHHDRMMLSLCEVLALTFQLAPDPATLCICEFPDMACEPGTGHHPSDPDRPCELCYALQSLGLDGWTTLEDVTAKLAALQEKLEAKMRPCAPPDSRVTG